MSVNDQTKELLDYETHSQLRLEEIDEMVENLVDYLFEQRSP